MSANNPHSLHECVDELTLGIKDTMDTIYALWKANNYNCTLFKEAGLTQLHEDTFALLSKIKEKFGVH